VKPAFFQAFFIQIILRNVCFMTATGWVVEIRIVIFVFIYFCRYIISMYRAIFVPYPGFRKNV